MELNEISGAIVASAMRVHSALGPGLLEEIYKRCLAHELACRGMRVLVEHNLPVVYRGVVLDFGFRLDLLVENAVVIELKTVQEIAPIHRAQLLSYLKLSKLRLGLLINFNTVHLKDGIIRLVNRYADELPAEGNE